MSAQDEGYQIALQEAKIGQAEGGLPVGACIVSKDGRILGRGRNSRYSIWTVLLNATALLTDAL